MFDQIKSHLLNSIDDIVSDANQKKISAETAH